MSSSKQSGESEYEIAYRSTIQPRTAVRTQSRQSGNYSSGTVVGGGGGKTIFVGFYAAANKSALSLRYEKEMSRMMYHTFVQIQS